MRQVLHDGSSGKPVMSTGIVIQLRPMVLEEDEKVLALSHLTLLSLQSEECAICLHEICLCSLINLALVCSISNMNEDLTYGGYKSPSIL